MTTTWPNGILGMRVLWFERDHERNRFRVRPPGGASGRSRDDHNA